MPRGGSKGNDAAAPKVKGRKSAYSFFVKEERKRWNEQKAKEAAEKKSKDDTNEESGKKDNDLGAFSTECSKRWKELAEAKRTPYIELANQDKIRYDAEKAKAANSEGKDEGGSAKRSRRVKDPAAPKRAKSAFLHFCGIRRPLLKQVEEHKDKKMTELSKILGAEWRKMTDEEKARYVEMEKKERDSYEEKKKHYQKTGGTAQPAKKGRGRPKKQKVSEEEEEDDDDDDDEVEDEEEGEEDEDEEDDDPED